MNNKTKAHLALLGTNIFFALNYTAVKQLINDGLVKPFGLNLVRVGVSMILLWALFIFKPVKSKISKADVGRFILCALTGIAINQLLFLKGLSMTYSIHASLLMLTTPILITIIAAWVLKERLTGYKVTGLLCGVLGAVVLITGKERDTEGDQVLLGDILIILNAISYTFYFVLVKPLMLKYNPIVVMRMIFTMGFFMILPFCWQEFTEIPWTAYSLNDYLLLILIVFCGTFLAYLFNVYGIKILGASIAGSYIYSQPVFAAIVAMMVLGETLTLAKIIAALLIFAGESILPIKQLKMPELILASSNEEFKAAALLFREYAQWIGIDLSFQKFEEELFNLKNMYAPPEGGIILYRSDNHFSGCIAVRKQQQDIAELKRMFVQPAFQRRGIGDQLLREALDLAVKFNYSFIRLDTLDHMTQAISIYRKYGFYEIDPYYYNPEMNAIFFEKVL